jgi:sialidase-1
MKKCEMVKTLLVIEPTKEAPRNSEGALVELKDGTLYLAYSRFTGGGADNSVAHISRRVSRDGGMTWSADEVLIEKEGRENVMSVSLLRLHRGEIVFGYLVKNSFSDLKAYVRHSTDEMKTVGERFCATPGEGYYVVNNDRLVQLSSGRILCPASLHRMNADGNWDPRGVAMCFISDDGGRRWRRSQGILEPPAGSESGLQEPGVVELLDGRIRMWARTDMGSQFESISEDGGETWTPVQPGPLKSPLSPASIKRVPWGKELLAVWNDHSGAHPFQAGRRTPLCAALSDDDGRTWRKSKVIEADPDGWYCYTLMTFVGDSVILGYCAGDRTVGGLNRLKLTRIHRDWLYGAP